MCQWNLRLVVRPGLSLLVLGSWVGVWHPFHLCVFLTAPRMASPKILVLTHFSFVTAPRNNLRWQCCHAFPCRHVLPCAATCFVAHRPRLRNCTHCFRCALSSPRRAFGPCLAAGPHWNRSWGNLSERTDSTFGVDAATACCACGDDRVPACSASGSQQADKPCVCGDTMCAASGLCDGSVCATARKFSSETCHDFTWLKCPRGVAATPICNVSELFKVSTPGYAPVG